MPVHKDLKLAQVLGTTSSYNLITALPTSFPLIDILKKTLLFFSIYVIVHTPRVNKVRYRISALSRGDRKKDGMRWGGSLRKGFIIFVDWIVVFLVLFVVFLDFGHDVLIVHDCRNSRRFGKKNCLIYHTLRLYGKKAPIEGGGREPPLILIRPFYILCYLIQSTLPFCYPFILTIFRRPIIE